MSDLVFSPWPHPAGRVAPGSAEVIYLRRALFVLRGTFFDPLTQRQAPLPRHRWVLAHSGAVFCEGNDSDADGISTIFEPAPGGAGPDDTWELMLIPLYDGRADSDVYAHHGEAWIDVERGVWVPGDQVRTEDEAAPYGRLSPDKLLRIPVWSTRRKVASGGGFAQDYPHAASFATTGELKTSELRPHGSRSRPWEMELDHGWLRTHVQLRFYDHLAKAERPIPQGVILQSTNTMAREPLGRSSVRLEDGSIYMLHAGDEGKTFAMVYHFETPRHARFALETDALEEGGDTRDHEELPGTHHFLPPRWGSLGQEAWVGPGDATADARKRFTQLRLEGKGRDEPLCFHLDDTVPTMLAGDVLIRRGERVALLDHHLAIRDPASADGKLLPYSNVAVKRFPLRAEEAIFVRGEGIERVTRVIEYEGRLFDVSRSHVRGDPLRANHVGCRAATPLLRHRERKRSELCVVDTSYVPYVHNGVEAKLVHVLVYVSCFITAPATDDQADGTNAARTVAVPIVEHLLHRSAEVWDQRHPAHGSPDDRKDYVAVPAGGLSAGARIIKVRHFFGSRPQLDRVPLLSGVDPKQNISIQIHPQAGRATGGDPMHLYLVYTNDLRAYRTPVDPHPAASRPYDFEEIVGRVMIDRLDGLSDAKFTLAHELGHSMELPDEYIETERPSADVPGELPCFRQSYDALPYSLEPGAMMVTNHNPRLRYTWAQLVTAHDVLENDLLRPEHWFHQSKPFFPQYTVGDRTMRFRVPYEGALLANDRISLWNEPTSGAVGLGTACLYPLGVDSSSVGPMFTDPSAGLLTEEFDGVLVFVVKYWFTFTTSIPRLDDRWEVMTDFGLRYQDRSRIPHFYVDTPAAPRFKKVALLVQPRFEYGPAPTTDSRGNAVPKSEADVEVIVRGDRGGARLAVHGAGLAEVKIRDRDVGDWLVRFALDPARWDTLENNEPLGTSDLAPLAAWLGAALGRAAGTIRSYG